MVAQSPQQSVAILQVVKMTNKIYKVTPNKNNTRTINWKEKDQLGRYFLKAYDFLALEVTSGHLHFIESISPNISHIHDQLELAISRTTFQPTQSIVSIFLQ